MQKNVIMGLAALWMAVGCVPTTIDDEFGGSRSEEVTEAQDEDDDDNNQQPSDAAGNCDNPYTLFPDGDSQTLPTTASALTGSCGGEGAEVVYEFTLEERSGVNIQVGGADVVVYLLKDTCDVTKEVEGSCADSNDPSAVEEINLGTLEPGTYYLVVDTYSAEVTGSYTIQWTVTAGGFCANDDYEPNNEAGEAVSLGASDIDTGALDQGEGEPTASVDFELCSDDVDFFSFGHMGGNVSVSHTVVEEAGTISGEVLQLVMVGDDDNGYTATAGDKMGDLPFTGDLDRGSYLVKLTATVPDTTNGPNYTIAVDHDCEADSLDAIDAEDDDGSLANNSVSLMNTLETPTLRTICGEDLDTFLLQNIVVGDVTATLSGGAALSAIVQSVGAEDALTVVAASTEVSGDDLVITLTNAAPGNYLVTVSANGVATTTEYGINAIFSGIENGPANGTCANAETLAFSADVASAMGHNINGTDDAEGPTLERDDGEGGTEEYSCNGEDLADEAMTTATADGVDGVGTPADVFYYMNLAAATDVEVVFDGTDSGFSGAVYMMNSGGTCPSDLSTLTYVNGSDDNPLCAVGTFSRVRLDDLAAGDYLLVVDGIFDPGFSFFGIPPSVTTGGFTLTTQQYPDGFPAIGSCVNATATTLPASGASVEMTVNVEDGESWIDSYADCGEYADRARGGNEQIFILEPTSDLTISVKAEGDYDTVVEIREANTTETGAFQCEKGTQVTCNDDGEGLENYGSLIESASLTSGKTYYLVVDAFNSSASGSVTVTLTAE